MWIVKRPVEIAGLEVRYARAAGGCGPWRDLDLPIKCGTTNSTTTMGTPINVSSGKGTGETSRAAAISANAPIAAPNRTAPLVLNSAVTAIANARITMAPTQIGAVSIPESQD